MIDVLLETLFAIVVGISLMITVLITEVFFGGVTVLGFFVLWAVIVLVVWTFFVLPYIY